MELGRSQRRWVAVILPLVLLVLLLREGQIVHGATPADRKEAGALLEAAMAADASPDLKKKNAWMAVSLVPGHPGLQIRAAVVLASIGESAAALDLLTAYAEAGLVADVAEADEWSGLRGMDGWPELLRKFDANAAPVEAISRVEVRMAPRGFFGEGIALDGDGEIWMSSYRSGHLVLVDRIGRVQAAFERPEGHGGAFGMAWDERRATLWVATGWLPVVESAADDAPAVSGIVAFDPKAGAWRRELRPPTDGRGHAFGDVCLLPDGGLVTSDSVGAAIYRWRSDDADGLEPWIVEGLMSPQGIAVDHAAGTVYVADHALGLFAVGTGEDGNGPTLDPISADLPVCQQGVDGLYFSRGWLIALQNGVNPRRVVAWRLDESGRRIVEQRVLARNASGMEEPTLGLVLNDEFWFVANSQWPKWNEDGEWTNDGKPEPPVLLRVALPK